MIPQIPLIVLTGPTAVGKTKLSISLAKAIHGEIISADSMQVYKGMDIGSAKITQAQMQNVPHHLIDILDPKDEFNVMIFQEQVKKCIAEIIERGNIPILTGGTGFYIQAILKDVDFKVEEENEYRKKLEELALQNGVEYIHNELLKIDPESAESIHANNLRRTIRALEYYYQTGEKFSVHNKREAIKPSPYKYMYFVLNDKRELLYERINQRVDEMLEIGLVDEVKRLIANGCSLDFVSMQGLGYKEIARYLQGEYSLDEAIYFIKRDTRHFAKRQLTWFKRESDVIWIDKSVFQYDDQKILDFILKNSNDIIESRSK